MEWVQGLSVLDKVYLGCGAVGSLLFVIRMILMFVTGMDDGGGGEVDGGGADADVQVDGPDGDHVSSDVSFHLLSFQGLTAFFMMFGLVGLAMSAGSGLGWYISMPSAVVAGLGTVWVIGRLFKAFGKMQHSGTMNLRAAVGQEGTVYLTIPADERGKVRVSVQDRLKVLDAVSADKEEIKTDKRVKVVDVIDGNVLVVRKV